MKRTRDESGSMLVELIVGMLLMGIVMTMVTDGILGGFKAQRGLTDRGEALESVRRAAQRVTREIREADSVSDATATTLRITHPTDGGSVERYYALDSTRTKLVQTTTVVGATTSTSTNVITDLDPTSSLFSYTPVDGYTASDSSINASTCAIASTAPVRYSHDCIGTVKLTLVRLVRSHTPVSVDALVDLRNVR